MSNSLPSKALIDGTVAKMKKGGKFDEMRKVAMNNIDNNPLYLNMEQIVNAHVSKYLEEITWSEDLNKNCLRSQIKSSIVGSDSLRKGIDALVDQSLHSSAEGSPLSVVKNFVNTSFVGLKHEFEPQYKNEFTAPEANHVLTIANSPPLEPKKSVSSLFEPIICPKNKIDEKDKGAQSSDVLVLESPKVFTDISQYKEKDKSKEANKENSQAKKRKKHKHKKRKKNLEKSALSNELNKSGHENSPINKTNKKHKKKSKKKRRHRHKDEKESSLPEFNENNVSGKSTPQTLKFYPKEKIMDNDRLHSAHQVDDQHQYDKNPFSQSSRVFPQHVRGWHQDYRNQPRENPPSYSNYSYHSRKNADNNYPPPQHPPGHVTPPGGNFKFAPPPTRSLTSKTSSGEILNKS